MSHNHDIPNLAVHERAAVHARLGPSVMATIPDHPKRQKITVERIGEPAFNASLSILECGCVALLQPTFAKSLDAAEMDQKFRELMTDQLSPVEAAQDSLAALLTLADEGGDVSAGQVREAEIALNLAERKARHDLAAQKADEKVVQARMIAEVSGPLVEELQEHKDILDHAQREALQGILRLVQLASDHDRLVEDALEALKAAGALGKPLEPGPGMSRILKLGDETHQSWPAQQWLAGVLHAASEQGVTLGESRWSRQEVPRLHATTPRPDTE